MGFKQRFASGSGAAKAALLNLYWFVFAGFLGFDGGETSVLIIVLLYSFDLLQSLASGVVARRDVRGLYFWTAREPRGCCAGRSARGESLDVSEATYETRGSDPTVL